jgi:hypothetical protein
VSGEGTPLTLVSSTGFVGLTLLGGGSYANTWQLYASGDGGSNKFFGIYDRTNSAYRLVTTSAGNVGIGTTNPTDLLFISGAFEAGGTNGLTIKSGRYPAVFLSSTNTGLGGVVGNAKLTINTIATGYGAGSLAGAMLLQGDNAIQLSTGGDNVRMTITSAGNVGIGTTSPGCTLSVVGSACVSVQLRAGTIASVGNIEIGGEILPTNCLIVRTAGTIRACIDSVGICIPGTLRAANVCATTSICGPMVCVSGEVSGLTVRGAHKAADGTSGINQDVSFVDASGYTHNFTFKDGLLTAYSVT